MSRGTVSELIRSVCKGLRGGGECPRLIRHSVFPGLIQAGLFSDGGAPRRESLEEALGGGGYCHF